MSEDIVDHQIDQKIRPLLALRKIAAARHQSRESRELTDRNGVRPPERAATLKNSPLWPSCILVNC
jgi:hypothetical protein